MHIDCSGIDSLFKEIWIVESTLLLFSNPPPIFGRLYEMLKTNLATNALPAVQSLGPLLLSLSFALNSALLFERNQSAFLFPGQVCSHAHHNPITSFWICYDCVEICKFENVLLSLRWGAYLHRKGSEGSWREVLHRGQRSTNEV